MLATGFTHSLCPAARKVGSPCPPLPRVPCGPLALRPQLSSSGPLSCPRLAFWDPGGGHARLYFRFLQIHVPELLKTQRKEQLTFSCKTEPCLVGHSHSLWAGPSPGGGATPWGRGTAISLGAGAWPTPAGGHSCLRSGPSHQRPGGWVGHASWDTLGQPSGAPGALRGGGSHCPLVAAVHISPTVQGHP